MNVLVIGQGGREHAIVKALHMSCSVEQIHAVPGNPGMKSEAVCHAISLSEVQSIVKLCERTDCDLVIIGPEAPLAEGMADQLRGAGLTVFGPSGEAARLEASKVYAKEFMVEAKVPTAHYKVVRSVQDVIDVVDEFRAPYVLKADGLAAGKGVAICETLEQLKTVAATYFEDKIFGSAGESALLEQFQEGWELSFFILTNGKDYIPLPLSQDHKRLGDGDIGPNTGGMGAIGPIALDSELEKQIHENILAPTVQNLKARELDYRGLLYVGLMVTPSGPSVIEYNVRFGDPEAQVILPLLEGDWGDVFQSIAKGDLPQLNWKPLYSACVVQAAPGYPECPEKGVPIEGNPLANGPSSYFLHAGTAYQEERWITNGGRVLNSIGIGSSLQEAIDNAYSQSLNVKWKGVQARTDIGQKILDRH